MGRSPCCSKVGMRRGPWSTKEDALLSDYILRHGQGQWRSLPKNAGLLRCGKSCRLRWMNYLRPGIKRGNINQDEEDLIVRMHRLLGNRWSLIAGRLPGRTDNEIKNYWNTHLLKKLHPEVLPGKPAKTKETGPGNQEKQHKKKEAAPPAKPQSKTEFKVYMPKPIRVSSVFSKTESYDSVTSGASSSEADKVYWPSLLQLEEGGYGYGGDDEDDCIMPLLQDSISGNAHMLYQVYDEYLQLL